MRVVSWVLSDANHFFSSSPLRQPQSKQMRTCVPARAVILIRSASLANEKSYQLSLGIKLTCDSKRALLQPGLWDRAFNRVKLDGRMGRRGPPAYG